MGKLKHPLFSANSEWIRTGDMGARASWQFLEPGLSWLVFVPGHLATLATSLWG